MILINQIRQTMKVYLDELSIDEFFANGGRVYINNGTIIDESNIFFERCHDRRFDPKSIEKCTIGEHYYDFIERDYEFRLSDIKKYLSPKDAYGIPNVNFSLITEQDERWEDFKQQRLEQGFDESETWALDVTIAKFIYPRLKYFYNDGDIYSIPCGLTKEEWCDIIKQMIDAFEILADDEMPTKEQNEIANNGLNLFAKYYGDLWN